MSTAALQFAIAVCDAQLLGDRHGRPPEVRVRDMGGRSFLTAMFQFATTDRHAQPSRRPAYALPSYRRAFVNLIAPDFLYGV